MEQNTQKFVYYTPVTAEEHFLFAGELAQIFCHLCGWETSTELAPVHCVSAYLKDKAVERKEQWLFYETRKGLSRVFPNGEADIMELNQILQKQYYDNRKRKQKITIRGKTYTLYMNEELAELNENVNGREDQ